MLQPQRHCAHWLSLALGKLASSLSALLCQQHPALAVGPAHAPEANAEVLSLVPRLTLTANHWAGATDPELPLPAGVDLCLRHPTKSPS